MKKKFLFVAMAIAMTIGFCSCNKDDDFNSADLVGDWQNTADTRWHRVYTTEAGSAEYEDYQWGYEYGEDGETTLADVQGSRHGNGWFMWKLEGSKLTALNAMDIGAGVIPYECTITTLNSTSLTYKENTRKKRTLSFIRVNN